MVLTMCQFLIFRKSDYVDFCFAYVAFFCYCLCRCLRFCEVPDSKQEMMQVVEEMTSTPETPVTLEMCLNAFTKNEVSNITVIVIQN